MPRVREYRSCGLYIYAEYQTYYNPSAHSSINISASYTIGYGRKVRRGDEVRGHAAAPSAILE